MDEYRGYAEEDAKGKLFIAVVIMVVAPIITTVIIWSNQVYVFKP